MILGLLLSGPLSLYDVRKRFAAGISHFYSASSGSIERALRRLVSEGTATVAAEAGSARGRRLYRITDAGRAAWREWMHAPTPPGSDAETTALAKVFLLGRLDDPHEQAQVLSGIRAEAEASREEHPEPPDGPKALDRAMQRAAQRSLRLDPEQLVRAAAGLPGVSRGAGPARHGCGHAFVGQ